MPWDSRQEKNQVLGAATIGPHGNIFAAHLGLTRRPLGETESPGLVGYRARTPAEL